MVRKNAKKPYFCNPLSDTVMYQKFRDVAQPGSALAWGARGRKFESCRPDLQNEQTLYYIGFAHYFLNYVANCVAEIGV